MLLWNFCRNGISNVNHSHVFHQFTEAKSQKKNLVAFSYFFRVYYKKLPQLFHNFFIYLGNTIFYKTPQFFYIVFCNFIKKNFKQFLFFANIYFFCNFSIIIFKSRFVAEGLDLREVIKGQNCTVFSYLSDSCNLMLGEHQTIA